MEIIWHILLTVCSNQFCIEQDVQWFETKEQCEEQRLLHEEIPIDGDWETIDYICKPVGSVAS